MEPNTAKHLSRSLALADLATLLLREDPDEDGKNAQTEALVIIGAAFNQWTPAE